MKEITRIWEEAISEKNCEKLLDIFDDYLDTIEDEDKLREELKRAGEVAVECENFDLLHEIAHTYEHLGEVEKGIELYKKVLEKRKNDKEKYAEALYYLADAYEHFGMPEEALKTYEELLRVEEELGNEKEKALTLANIAIVKDELENVEEAIRLMEKARDIFAKLKDEKNYLISLIDLAHFNYELGKYDEAMELIQEVLRNPIDKEVEVHSRLVESEIYAGKGENKKAAISLRKALQRAEDDEELFGIAFESVLDFIEGLFNEGNYNALKEVSPIFAELFEDDTREFFKAIEKLAEWRLGDENAKVEFEELYKRIENEDLKAMLDEWKRPKLSLGLGLSL
ncbi:lipopolysaccharide assembly protein LapB [Pyrococcus sp. ST04]|uniref:tetratricopeptide repeat protein n=1 Tax=Pyrococcus sp. ST04 TaxID=1183377 RepID=UPI000260590B|nr:tetratricopeptide repeat protein [Pyrococcus sp. ST04]AFK21692.1 putative TRP-repeat-containing protein [Pyrococcus sp. ST04]